MPAQTMTSDKNQRYYKSRKKQSRRLAVSRERKIIKCLLRVISKKVSE